jgi:hypothetical protein
MNTLTHASRGLLVLLTCLFPGIALACSCGCGVFDVGTDSMFPEGPGVMAFAEYDVLNQNENWHGNSRAPSGDNEDKRIQTGFMSAGVRYMFDPSWGITLVVPYWDRHFRTTDEDTGDPTTHTHSAFGDARIVGVYSGFAADGSTGVTFGVKLPTGDDDYHGFDPDTEIGSGSTDLLLGAYHRGSLDTNGSWAWLVDAQLQQPVAHKNSYRPGAELDGAVGVSYRGWLIFGSDRVAPLVQLKGVYRDNDGGRQGDPDNSGYTRVVLSPGLQLDTGKITVHMDAGIPLYTHTEGNQLVAPALWKLNVGYRF